MAKEVDLQTVTIEGGNIVWPNFAGLQGRFNAKGDRNFNVFLDDDIAKAMEADGWNVRWVKAREEGDPDRAIITVAVKYIKRDGTRVQKPPRIVMITSRGKTHLGEDLVPILDWADVENADMIIRPSRWEVNGKTGIKAYLQALYVTIREDELERKYIDVPDSAANSIGVDHDDPEEETPF